MNYCILRTKKIKSRGHITRLALHNFRLRSQKNIDEKRTKCNQVLVNSLNVDTSSSTSLSQQVGEHYKKLGIREKSNNVLMLEFVVSASPQFFNSKSKQDIEKWAQHQVDFFQKEFDQQLKMAILHLDETSPHIHFCVTTEHLSVKKYKNQKGEFHKETWSLNAKRYDPEFLAELHTRHALHNKPYGLVRGVRGSVRSNTPLKEFYRAVDKAMSTDYIKVLEEEISGLKKGLLGGISVEEINNKLMPIMNKFAKTTKAVKTKYKIELKPMLEAIQLTEKRLKDKELELLQFENNLKEKKEVYSEAINSSLAQSSKILKLESENKELKSNIEKFSKSQAENNIRPTVFKAKL